MKAPRLSLVVTCLCMLMLVTLALTTLLARPPLSNAQGPMPPTLARASATVVDSSFTYQGQLKVNGEPYNGGCDFQFALFDTAVNGQQLGSTQTITDQVLRNGLFTVVLNRQAEFGPHVFNGEARWLEVSARCSTETYYRPLLPRQALTAAPYAHSLQPGAVILGSLQTPLLSITNTAGIGIYAESDKVGVLAVPESGAWAIYGEAPYKAGVGVYGHAGGGWGIGVSGHGMTGVSGTGEGPDLPGQTQIGVQGQGRVGVSGSSTITNGIGVNGFTIAPGGIGVNGVGGPGGFGVSGRIGRRELADKGNIVAPPPQVTAGTGVYGEGPIGVSGVTRWIAPGIAVQAMAVDAGTPLVADYEGSYTPTAIAAFQANGTNKARIDGDGRGYFNGGTQTGGADVAEFVAATDTLQPGDVVEIDPDHAGQFRLAATPNTTAVAGVISTQPGVSLNAKDPAGALRQTEPQLALIGRVPVKVSTENGLIQAGDLLVASATRGHAMRAPASPAPGTVIGKALGNLDSGTGVVEMLVMLR
ncbi:MAG: hypothetical protein U0641_18060 [Anaerolineae bacterium]